MLRVSIVVGNPKPQSRTLRVAQIYLEKLLPDKEIQLEVIDLATHASDLFKWPSDVMATLNANVAQSDLVLFASPTYKATYTGLLKAFLDRYPANGLRGVVALPIMTGADQTHSMAPTTQLVPVLIELGASVPFRPFYFVMSQMDSVETIVNAAVCDQLAFLKQLNALIGGLNSSPN